MSRKRLTVLVMGMVLMLTIVACGNKETNNKKINHKKAEVTTQKEVEIESKEETKEEIKEEVKEENKEELAEVITEEKTETKTTATKKPTVNKTNNATNNTTNNTANAGGNNSNSTPKPAPVACEHWYQPEFKPCSAKKHYIFGCNGCGYPLFTIEDHDAVNLPDLYSHPPYYSEKLGQDCTGGGFHSEMYYQGYCATCHSEIQLRSCNMFYVMGQTCVKNEVLGAYEKVETGRYPAAYIKSCDCGQNILLAGDDDNSGLLIVKETCMYCGDVKTYPEH